MTPQELQQRIIDEELPSSESGRLVSELDCQCPHFIEGACERPELHFYESLDEVEF